MQRLRLRRAIREGTPAWADSRPPNHPPPGLQCYILTSDDSPRKSVWTAQRSVCVGMCVCVCVSRFSVGVAGAYML